MSSIVVFLLLFGFVIANTEINSYDYHGSNETGEGHVNDVTSEEVLPIYHFLVNDTNISFRKHISITFVSLYVSFLNGMYTETAILSEVNKDMNQEEYTGSDFTVKYMCCKYYINHKDISDSYIFSFERVNKNSFQLNFCSSKYCINTDEINKNTPLYRNISEITDEKKQTIKEEIKRMFMKSYNSYMRYAFPHNEIHPITCKPYDLDLTPFVLTTLIDMLDTFAVMGDYDELYENVKTVCNTSLISNRNVSVFETTIRVIGGLLSAHTIIISNSTYQSEYDNCLLNKAIDLADRIMFAFDTPAMMPHSRINLLTLEVDKMHNHISAAAEAGTMYLEFGYLSSLTSNMSYINSSRNSLIAVYKHRSMDDLVGTFINITSDEWISTFTGLGSGIDSFYEYILKGYILFNDKEMYKMYKKLSNVIEPYLVYNNSIVGNIITNPSIYKFDTADSLSSFFPGLLAQINENLTYNYQLISRIMHVWKRFDYLPESVHMMNEKIIDERYILRPESIESLYHIYRITHDKEILLLAYDILERIRKLEVKCGFAYIKSIKEESLEDEMPSFFLAETLKYLYLIFDENNQFTSDNYLFTTESHIFNITIAQSKEIREFINSQNVIVNETDEKCVYKYQPIEYICPASSIYETTSIIKSVEEYMKNSEKIDEDNRNINIQFEKTSVYDSGVGFVDIEYSADAVFIRQKYSNETVKIYNVETSSPIFIDYSYETIISKNYMYNRNDDTYTQCSLYSSEFETDVSCLLFGDLNNLEVNKEINLIGLSIIDNYNFTYGCDDYRIQRDNTNDEVYIYVEDGECITDVKIRQAINAGANGIVIGSKSENAKNNSKIRVNSQFLVIYLNYFESLIVRKSLLIKENNHLRIGLFIHKIYDPPCYVKYELGSYNVFCKILRFKIDVNDNNIITKITLNPNNNSFM